MPASEWVQEQSKSHESGLYNNHPSGSLAVVLSSLGIHPSRSLICLPTLTRYPCTPPVSAEESRQVNLLLLAKDLLELLSDTLLLRSFLMLRLRTAVTAIFLPVDVAASSSLYKISIPVIATSSARIKVTTQSNKRPKGILTPVWKSSYPSGPRSAVSGMMSLEEAVRESPDSLGTPR